jgi:hypothetical protein
MKTGVTRGWDASLENFGVVVGACLVIVGGKQWNGFWALYRKLLAG